MGHVFFSKRSSQWLEKIQTKGLNVVLFGKSDLATEFGDLSEGVPSAPSGGVAFSKSDNQPIRSMRTAMTQVPWIMVDGLS